jgi:lipid II:glycine glycyltransferase (peptidoglycan interpeptide bridge formation enzyme)
VYIKPIDTLSEQYLKLSQNYGSVFNQKDWISIYNEQIIVLGLFNKNNDLIGAFNVFKAKKLGFSYYITPPYAPSNGLFFINPALNNANQITFAKEVHELIAQYFLTLNGFLILSAFPSSTIDMQNYYWKKFKVIPNYTYQINLLATEEVLFDNLTSEKRKSIRKAQKDELKIENCKDYKIVKSLILKTFERKSKNIDSQYLDKILFQFASENNSFAFVAYNGSLPIACTFIVYHNTTCYYLFGGYDSANRHHGAGVSCMWSAILHAKKIGISTFDFEGSMLQEVEKYFREFGGELVPYYTINKANYLIECLLKISKPQQF